MLSFKLSVSSLSQQKIKNLHNQTDRPTRLFKTGSKRAFVPASEHPKKQIRYQIYFTILIFFQIGLCQ